MLHHTLPGKAAKGFILYTDLNDGKRLFEGDMRQCVHCQMVWTYKPGSGKLRGFCWRCGGHTCGKRACMDCYPAEKRVEDIEALARRVKGSIEAAVRRQNWFESIGL